MAHWSYDYEPHSHDITVLATSTDGSTSSKNFTISVINDANDGPLEITLLDYGFDPSNDQNFVEFSATGSFGESTGILIGFENPEVVDPLNGTGMSSLLDSLILTPEDRVQKYYFNEFVGNIAPKSAFFLADGGSTAFDEDQLNELKSGGEVSLPVPLSDTSYGEFSYDGKFNMMSLLCLHL